MAYGLHNMYQDVCGRDAVGLCPDLFPFNGSLFKVSHTSFSFNDPLLTTYGISGLRQGVALRSALLWVTTQPTVVIPYRRFGTTYRSHLQGLEDGIGMTLEDGTGRLSRSVGKELPLYAT